MMAAISNLQVAVCFKSERGGHQASECRVKQNNENYIVIFKCGKKGQIIRVLRRSQSKNN